MKPQIMVPLVATPEEFSHQLGVIREVYAEVFDEGENCVPFEVGAMVETPRAALVVRVGAKFLSLGTNDLTQMTFGFSRDDIGPILSTYRENGILSDDPFERIDERGVGVLVENCARTARDMCTRARMFEITTLDIACPTTASRSPISHPRVLRTSFVSRP